MSLKVSLKVFIPFIVFLAGQLLSAQVQPVDLEGNFNQQVRQLSQGMNPVYWPVRGIPRFESETIEKPFDGGRVQRTIFRGPIVIETEPLSGWVGVNSQRTRYSLLAYGQGQAQVQFGFAYMSREAFLPEKTRDALLTYALGLLVRRAPQTEVTILTDFEKPLPRKPFSFLGQVPLTLDYKILDEKTGIEKVRREYFVKVEDAWIVFCIENTPARIQQTINQLAGVLTFAAVVQG